MLRNRQGIGDDHLHLAGEVLALGDRVAVMYEGRIVGILDAKQATRERVGLLMGGITK
jgi:simple sugar transport system ATP-binding protein